jgi:hypothetical protein
MPLASFRQGEEKRRKKEKKRKERKEDLKNSQT